MRDPAAGTYDVAELARRLANLVRLGTVEAADYGAARVRPRRPGVTGWLPWWTRRAGGDVDW